MTTTAEITAQVESISSEIGDGTTQAGAALERAVELTEEAAGHGWEGVATSMQGCQDALEAVIASLGTAATAIDETLSVLRAITDQMSRPDVTDHLGQALDRLDQVRTAVEAADSGVDDARQSAEQAGGPESLMGMLHGVGDAVDTAWRGLDGAKGAIESEQQQAGTWGN